MALGYPHPDALLAALTSRQVGEWVAFSNIEPWWEERADYRAGIIASTIANVFRGKNQKPFKPSDFMPDFSKKPENSLAKKTRKILSMFKKEKKAPK